MKRAKYFWASGGMAGRALTQGLYFLLLAGVLGPAELGRLAIFTAITTTLAPLSGVGCSEVLLKNTARDPGALAHGYGHCRGIIPVSALAIALPAAAAGWACLDLARDWPTLLCLGAIDIVALRYQEVLLAMTQALEDFKANASIALVMSLAKLAGVGAMLVLPVPRTVAGWSVVQLAALGPATALLCRWCRRRYLAVPAGWRIDPALVREGTLFAVGVSVNGAYRDIDKLFLGKVVASAQLGLYATAYRLLDLAFIPVRAMLYVALPRMFRSGGRDSGAGGDRRFVARSLLAALAAFLAYQAALHGLPWLLGQRFQGIGAMGRILGLMLFGRTLLNYGAYRVLTGRGVKYSCLVQGLAALASLVLCWALIPGGGWRAAAWISVGTDFLFAGLYLVLCRPNRRPVPEQP